jgi:hypothetical protein
MKPNYMWCIDCERIVPNWATPMGTPYHVNFTSIEDDVDLMNCYGPFAYSTPPAIPENWHEMVVEPSPEELAEMDKNAELLLADLQPVE